MTPGFDLFWTVDGCLAVGVVGVAGAVPRREESASVAKELSVLVDAEGGTGVVGEASKCGRGGNAAAGGGPEKLAAEVFAVVIVAELLSLLVLQEEESEDGSSALLRLDGTRGDNGAAAVGVDAQVGEPMMGESNGPWWILIFAGTPEMPETELIEIVENPETLDEFDEC